MVINQINQPEEHPSDGGGEAAGHPHRAGRLQHLGVAGLVGVDALEGGDELGEEGGHDGGDVDEGPLLAERHAGPQGGRQAHHLGHQRPERGEGGANIHEIYTVMDRKVTSGRSCLSDGISGLRTGVCRIVG